MQHITKLFPDFLHKTSSCQITIVDFWWKYVFIQVNKMNLPLEDWDVEYDDGGADTEAELGACDVETELGCPALDTWDLPATIINNYSINQTKLAKMIDWYVEWTYIDKHDSFDMLSKHTFINTTHSGLIINQFRSLHNMI